MERLLVTYRQGPQQAGWFFVGSGEEPILHTAVHSLLSPLNMSPEEALRELNGLPPDAPLSELGRDGPPLAAASGKANADNPLAGAYPDYYGRDSLWIARLTHEELPFLRSRTVRFWLERLGREEGTSEHEQPWRAPHRFHKPGSPLMPALPGADRDPEATSFGSLDATPMLAADAIDEVRLRPEVAFQRIDHYTGTASYTYAEAIDGMLALIRTWRSSNAEGLIESEAIAGVYKSFPFWKDSPYAYMHRTGELATPPVSSVEVVGYAYSAFAAAAELARNRPELGWNVDELQKEAESLRRTLFEHYWLPDRGYFALGTDRSGPDGAVRPLEVKASNMGHLLGSGILAGEEHRPYREAIVRSLLSADMLCPAGVCTLSWDELLFSPTRYHNGPAWVHEQMIIADGMAEHYPALALLLARAVERNVGRYYPEFLPASRNTQPAPSEWNVRVRMRNVYGETIEPTVEKSPQPLTGWAVAARKSADALIARLESEGRLVATHPEDRRLEEELQLKAATLLGFSGPATTVQAVGAPTRRPAQAAGQSADKLGSSP